MPSVHFHHLPMKLWEGNVFTGVCHSAQGESHVTITHVALDFTVQGPTPTPSVQGPALSEHSPACLS